MSIPGYDNWKIADLAAADRAEMSQQREAA